jgi:endonuclease I
MSYRRTWIWAGVLAGVVAAAGVRADIYDAPAGYYASAAGLNGAALKYALHGVIDDHTVVSYNNARYALQMTDQDPTNRDRLILFYDNTPLSLIGLSASGINGWDSGASWQREHTWPQSRQITSSGATTTTGADYSDLHMLRPAGSANQDRGNANYGGTGTVPGIVSGGYYFPGNAHKGEAARGAFYAAVRYDGSDANTVNLELQNGNPAANQGLMGDLASLLRYHYEDPVNTQERRRNDLIYRSDNWTNKPSNWNGAASYTQGNRNPFVDHPEFVWSVFGGSANDSRISVATAAGDGSSAKVVDFGRVIVGASVGALSQPLTISKDGVAPTYYEVTTTGSATSSVVGRYNAFTYNAGSAVTQIGLNASTATPGLRTGEVRVNNLDLTSSGAGRGSADGDDVVSLQLSVLARSEASWSASANVDSAAAMFGAVEVGTTATIAVSLHNLVAVAGGAGFTAGLDVDAVSLVSVPGSDLFGVAGGAEAFAADLGVSSNLLAGDEIEFDVTFTPTQSGPFAAMLTVWVSDENLPGAGAGTPLTLSLSGLGTVVIPEPGMLGVLVGVWVLGRRRARGMAC